MFWGTTIRFLNILLQYFILMRWLNSITYSVDMNLSKVSETVKDRGAWHAVGNGVTKSQDTA